MSDPSYNRSNVVRESSKRTTWGVIAVVVAVIIVVSAIYAYDNSIGSDTSGDDTRYSS